MVRFGSHEGEAGEQVPQAAEEEKEKKEEDKEKADEEDEEEEEEEETDVEALHRIGTAKEITLPKARGPSQLRPGDIEQLGSSLCEVAFPTYRSLSPNVPK